MITTDVIPQRSENASEQSPPTEGTPIMMKCSQQLRGSPGRGVKLRQLVSSSAAWGGVRTVRYCCLMTAVTAVTCLPSFVSCPSVFTIHFTPVCGVRFLLAPSSRTTPCPRPPFERRHLRMCMSLSQVQFDQHASRNFVCRRGDGQEAFGVYQSEKNTKKYENTHNTLP